MRKLNTVSTSLQYSGPKRNIRVNSYPRNKNHGSNNFGEVAQICIYIYIYILLYIIYHTIYHILYNISYYIISNHIAVYHLYYIICHIIFIIYIYSITYTYIYISYIIYYTLYIIYYILYIPYIPYIHTHIFEKIQPFPVGPPPSPDVARPWSSWSPSPGASRRHWPC